MISERSLAPCTLPCGEVMERKGSTYTSRIWPVALIAHLTLTHNLPIHIAAPALVSHPDRLIRKTLGAVAADK